MFGQGLSKGILRLFGWKWDALVPNLDKCVVCVAPHTSNWDFIMGRLGYTALGRYSNFVIKQEWMKGFPGWVLTKLGGIGVDRSKPSFFTDHMAELYRTREKFNLAITPEGTRKANPKWKKGFYHIAIKANVPINLVRIDYKKKEMCVFDVFYPTGDEQADIFAIQQKYVGVSACHPEKVRTSEQTHRQMRISLIQSDIIWEHKTANLLFYESLLSGLTGKTDLAVLPEMCTTGFSMHPALLAETIEGETLTAFKRMAAGFGFAIAGTFIGQDESHSYNRAFFVQPDGKVDVYDKRHLFRMGDEGLHYTSGNEKKIVSYLGWNIRLAVCYELRFPVWLRNVKNDYDLLLLMANWPESRQHVWTSLLTARALENQAYVCGVNRVGTDANGITYSGGSMLVNAYGTTLTETGREGVSIQTLDLNLEELHRFREKFPVWKDADAFKII